MNNSQSRPRRRYGVQIAAAVAAFSLALSLIPYDVGGQAASAAVAPRIITAEDRASLAAGVAESAFPSGATTAVVAASGSREVLIGANLASRADEPLLVAEDAQSAGGLVTSLNRLHVSEVVLVGSAETKFGDSFKDDLRAAGVSVSQEATAASDFELSLEVARIGNPSPEYVLADRADQFASALAASYASTRGVALILFSSGTADEELKAFYESVGDSVLTYIGDPSTAPTGQMTTDQAEQAFIQDSTDRTRVAVWAAAQMQSVGRNAAQIVTAPSDSKDGIALAGLYARVSGGIALPAGKRNSLTESSASFDTVKAWGSEVQAVTLVGLGLGSADLLAFSGPSGTTPAAPPVFRVTDLARSSTGTYALRFTPVAGATAYRAYGTDGEVVSSTTSSPLRFTESVPALRVAAVNGSSEIARFNFRVNSFDTAEMRDSVVTGTIVSGVSNLRFLGPEGLPRLITRSVVDPYVVSSEATAEVPVAITCAPSWTERGLDSTKQYEYGVSELTNVSSQACDPSVAPASATEVALNSARLALPSTTVPKTASAFAMRSSNEGSESSGAALTRVDMMMQQQSETSGLSARLAAPRGLGDGWADVKVRWQAYIPESKLPGGLSGSFSRPVLAIHGDGHGSFQPNGSARFIQDLRVGFGSDHYVRYDNEQMGETIQYACKPIFNDCVVSKRATAPLSELSGGATLSTNVFGAGWFRASARMPLIKVAPPIDTDVQIYLGPGVSRIFGYHDRMPKHEAYFGVVQSEWYRVYSSPYIGYAQLPCLVSSPQKIWPRNCGVRFNAQI
jgi:hypothetical protein